MKIIVLDSAFIYDFEFDSQGLRNNIENYIKEKYLKNVKSEKRNELSDWIFYLSFIYNNVNNIAIYLKGKSLSKDKYKEITVHIPYPNTKQANWGEPEDKFVYRDTTIFNKNASNFEHLSIDFKKFNNLFDYSEYCMLKTVDYIFSKGFKINGVLIKD